jgi:predicted transcriptional regulator
MRELKFRGRVVPCEEKTVAVDRLAFYPENPRIYSRFAGEQDRTQGKIQKTLETMEHVKSLRSRLDRDGQVNEPLYCMVVEPDSQLDGDYDFQVLEGNSRLAAIRMERKGSLPLTTVPCYILDFSSYSPTDKESLIFSILGDFHIVGKTNWETYENAAYIHRRFNNQGATVEQIAKDIDQTPAKVRHMISAFDMMIQADDNDTNHWSYYEAYVSSSRLRKHRDDIPGLDERVVDLIKEGEFPRALDMRDKLPDILRSQRARRIFLDEGEENPFKEALEVAELSGDTDAVFKRLQRFRNELGTQQTRRQIIKLLKNSQSRGNTKFELEKIVTLANQLLKRVPDNE